MRRRHFLGGIALLTFLAGCGGSRSVPSDPSSFDRSVVFRLTPGTDVDHLAHDYGLSVLEGDATTGVYRFGLRSGDDDHVLLDRLHQDKRFSEAERDEGVRAPEPGNSVSGDPIHVPFDFVSPSDSRFASLARAYSLPDASATVNTTAFAQVRRDSAFTVTQGAGITVAVLDTGVQPDHPSLRSRLLPGYNALQPKQQPLDIADGTQNRALGHGTMIAGIIAQLAPEAKILPVRVLNADGSGAIFHVVRGLSWAVQQGAHVVNLSFGTTTASPILRDAIASARRAGVIVVASAGNAGLEQVDYPAGFSDVLGVAAVEADDTRAPYSNYGTHLRLAAPGTGITSTYVGSGFATWSGTSFAAPFVAGAAALVRAAHPGWSADQVTSALIQSARAIDSQNPTIAGKLGSGVVDCRAAVNYP